MFSKEFKEAINQEIYRILTTTKDSTTIELLRMLLKLGE